MSAILLKGGRVIDPSQNVDHIADLRIEDGKVVENFSPNTQPQTFDVTGKVVCPGLIDIHTYLREPGQSAKETIRTGTAAAAAGGFTSVLAMPNTNPPADAPNTIAWLRQRAAETGLVNVFPTGCISAGRKGETLSPIGSLQKAGVVAITDSAFCIQSNELMRRALEYSTMFDLPVLDHCQDYSLVGNGVMNEGYWSTVLGLAGWPAIGEEMIVSRNALLSELTGARVLCQHLSSAGSVRILREARQRGVRISAEASPHHLALTEESLESYDTHFKTNPPLRTQRDREALLQGVADGTIEFLASAHAPHCSYEKEVEFDEAPFGIIGLETALGIFLKHLVHSKIISLAELIRRLTTLPSDYLKLQRGTLRVGSVADVTVIDPDLEWTVDASKLLSKSRNTPFHGAELKGRATATIVAGKMVWNLEQGLIEK